MDAAGQLWFVIPGPEFLDMPLEATDWEPVCSFDCLGIRGKIPEALAREWGWALAINSCCPEETGPWLTGAGPSLEEMRRIRCPRICS